MNRTSPLTTVRAAVATVGLLGVAAAPAVASALALRVGLRAWDGPIRLLGPDDLAVIAGALAALAASLWLFAAVVAALPEAWRTARAAARGGRPPRQAGTAGTAGAAARRTGAVRRLVIAVVTVAALGVGASTAPAPGAVASPAAAPAAAAQAQVPLGWALTGQGADSPALGWQPTATAPADQASPASGHGAAHQSEVRVRPGDSLWTIAAAHLPPGATAAQIRDACSQWYAANHDRIGDDPDLLHPGTLLRPPR